MSKWKVSLKDPLYTGRTYSKELYSEIIEADTEYGAKKAFYDSLLSNHPEVPKTPFSAILPHLKLQKINSKKPKFSEFPPDKFFEAIRNNLRQTPIEEELENSRYLCHLITFITEEGLTSGYIPKECPICRRPIKVLEIHHWNAKKDIGNSYKYRNFSIMKGFYRRMCKSCNVNLGGIFKKKYPIKWKNQWEKLMEYFQYYPKTYTLPLEEGWWSLLSEKEWNRLKYIWDHTPKLLLQKSFTNPKLNRKLLKTI